VLAYRRSYRPADSQATFGRRLMREASSRWPRFSITADRPTPPVHRLFHCLLFRKLREHPCSSHNWRNYNRFWPKCQNWCRSLPQASS